MAIQVPQSTSRVVMLKLYLAGTATPATGKILAIVLSKNNSAFANPSAGATNATELSNGWYAVTVSTTDTNTIGDLVVRGTAAACDDSERVFGIVKATNAGLTALPDTAVTSNASLITSGTGGAQLNLSAGTVTVGTNNDKTGYSLTQSFPTNFGLISIDGSGRVLLQPAQAGVTIPTVTTVGTLTTYTGNTPQTGDSYTRLGAPTLANIAADIQSRLATVGYTAPQNATILAAIAALPTLAQILAGGNVDGFTIEQTFKLVLAAVAGKISGAATTTVVARAASDSKPRITATVDVDGNRTAITLDAA